MFHDLLITDLLKRRACFKPAFPVRLDPSPQWLPPSFLSTPGTADSHLFQSYCYSYCYCCLYQQGHKLHLENFYDLLQLILENEKFG